MNLSCIRIPRSFHALGYKNQKVIIDSHHTYRVGFLSEEWERISMKSPGIIFRHQRNRATLATEALCGAAYEDLPLRMLTGHLLAGLKKVEKIEEKYWKLSGREALYTRARASLDGVETLLNVVVVKKHQCHFDFMAVSMPHFGEEVTEDFLTFVKGFDY